MFDGPASISARVTARSGAYTGSSGPKQREQTPTGSSGNSVSQMRQRSAVAGITGTPSVRGSASDRVWHHAPLEQVAEASQGRFPQPLSMRSRTASSASSLVGLYKIKSSQHGSFGSRGDVARIPRENALRVLRCRRLDRGQARRDLVV